MAVLLGNERSPHATMVQIAGRGVWFAVAVRWPGLTEALQWLEVRKLIECGRRAITILNRKGIERMRLERRTFSASLDSPTLKCVEGVMSLIASVRAEKEPAAQTPKLHSMFSTAELEQRPSP
jgi:hypothetical protein